MKILFINYFYKLKTITNVLKGFSEISKKISFEIDIKNNDILLKDIVEKKIYNNYDAIIGIIPFLQPEIQKYWDILNNKLLCLAIIEKPLNENNNYIIDDSYYAFNNLLKILKNYNYLKIGFFNYNWSGYALTRFLNFKKVMINCKLKLNQNFIHGFDINTNKFILPKQFHLSWKSIPRNKQKENREKEIKKYFSKTNLPEVIITPTDDIALDIINYCNINKINIPKDIAIVGFDNNPEVSNYLKILYNKSFLTTVELPFKDIGKNSIILINDILNNKLKYFNNHILLKPNIIVGESIKKNITINFDENFKKQLILEIINKYYHQNNVAEILSDNLEISKQYFLIKFKKLFTINFTEYINKFRVEKAYELIKHSNYSITRIIFEVGFNERRIFYYWFNKVYDENPRNIKKIDM